MEDKTVEISLEEFKKEFPKKKMPNPRQEIPKPIDQYDFEGVYIRSFKNISEANEVLRIPRQWIRESCEGKRFRVPKSGFIFLYEDGNIDDRMTLIEKQKRPKVVYEYSLDGKFLHKWMDSGMAARANNTSTANIYCCLSQPPRSLTCCGKIFLHAGESIEKRLKQIEKQAALNSLWRPIKEYTIDGKFVKDWPNEASAKKYYGITGDLQACLKGKCAVVEGRIFLYPEDSIEERLKRIANRRHAGGSRTKIKEYDIDGVYIRTWKYQAEAEEYYGFSKGKICRCCRGDALNIGNKIFLKIGERISKRLKLIKEQQNKKKKKV